MNRQRERQPKQLLSIEGKKEERKGKKLSCFSERQRDRYRKRENQVIIDRQKENERKKNRELMKNPKVSFSNNLNNVKIETVREIE